MPSVAHVGNSLPHPLTFSSAGLVSTQAGVHPTVHLLGFCTWTAQYDWTKSIEPCEWQIWEISKYQWGFSAPSLSSSAVGHFLLLCQVTISNFLHLHLWFFPLLQYFFFIFNTSEFHPKSFLSALQFKSWNIPLLLEALGFSLSNSLPLIFSTFHWQFCLSQNNLTSCLLSSKSDSDLVSASLIYSLQKHYVGWVLGKFWEMVQRAVVLGTKTLSPFHCWAELPYLLQRSCYVAGPGDTVMIEMIFPQSLYNFRRVRLTD